MDDEDYEYPSWNGHKIFKLWSRQTFSKHISKLRRRADWKQLQNNLNGQISNKMVVNLDISVENWRD